MTGWAEFGVALGLFTGSHFVPRLGGLRERAIAALGRRAYFSIYGLLSLALLVWIVVAAGRAPYVELWPQLPWTRWVPNLVMPVAVVLAACGAGIAQPYTVGGKRGARFDPDAPGFAGVSRHPLLLALGLWALAHLFPNGDLAHVILFGSFAILALAAMPLFDLHARRSLAPDAARRYFERTALLSPAPFADRAWLRRMAGPLLLRTGIGLALWIALLHLHGPVIGAAPLPY